MLANQNFVKNQLNRKYTTLIEIKSDLQNLVKCDLNKNQGRGL